MKKLMMVAALLTANVLLSSTVMAEDFVPGKISTVPEADQPVPPEPVSSPVTPNKAYDDCIAQINKNGMSNKVFNEKVLECRAKFCPSPDPSMEFCVDPGPPAPPKAPTYTGPVTCQYPDETKLRWKQKGGCECEAHADHDAGANFTEVMTNVALRKCVLWRVVLADTRGQLDKCGTDCDDLRGRLAALEALVANKADRSELQGLLDELANDIRPRLGIVERRLDALEPKVDHAQKTADEALTKANVADAKADLALQHNQSNVVLRLDGLVGFGFRGRAKADLRLGLHAEIEGDFPETVVGLVIGAGVGLQGAHAGNTFGRLLLPQGDLSLRIYTTMSRKFAIDLGVTSMWYLMADHEAGYQGLRSPIVGSSHGPHVGVMWDLARYANLMARCGVGFGPVNSFVQGQDGNPPRVALNYPAQPWCMVGGGLTLGK